MRAWRVVSISLRCRASEMLDVRPRLGSRQLLTAWLIAVLVATGAAASVGSCLSDAPVCVAGDRLGCRCDDGTYGYTTCSSVGQYGPDAACDCVRGLTPDASSP